MSTILTTQNLLSGIIMRYVRTKVKCHSGYKLNEYPIAFEFQNRFTEITEIVDRWYEGGIDVSRPALYYFKVRSMEGKLYLLRYDPLFNTWHLADFDQKD
ncbi:MAG: hypothetical protein EHM72_11270 [Calditrichaeota bacterium]|nr:MAG: hypothetical protein EHM72_11270 [Calditrichota bacterium]